jgi:hypothetical protein
VPEEIARVARYGQQLQDLLDGKELELSGDHDALLIAHWNLLLDYHPAIVTLLAQELHGAAFALMRPIIEAWVRIHVTKMGSDEEVLAIKEDKYRVDFKTIGALIDGAFALNGFFEKTLLESRVALHSYTHSGSFQITRRFQGYSEGATLNVTEGSMTALFRATIVVTKHFGFEDEWRTTTELFAEYNKRPSEVPESTRLYNR